MPARRRNRVLTARGMALCLILGLITALAIAAAMGWFLDGGAPSTYEASPSGNARPNLLTRKDFLGSSWYQELRWSRGSPFESRRAREIRDTFHSAAWKSAAPPNLNWSIGGPDTHTVMIEWGWPCR